MVVGESRHRLAQDCKQFMLQAMSVVPIEPIFTGSVRRHAVRALEAKGIADVPAHQGHFFDDYFVLTHT